MTIAKFLADRFDEDEAKANLPILYEPVPEDCWHSEKVLAVLAAHRQIMEMHQSSQDTRGVGQQRDGKWTPYCEFDLESWPCDHARILASVYTEHPDFNPEWSA